MASTVELLDALGPDCKVLAGGQSLVPMLSMRLTRFDHLVDINRIPDLRSVSGDGSRIRIGSAVRQADAEQSALVASTVPLLAKALPLVGHFQIRNRGTVGGSIAHADPAAELPAVAMTLDAHILTAGPSGSRRLPAGDFFVSTWETSLHPAEIITDVEFQSWPAGSGFAIEEVARRHGDFALVGMACGVQLLESEPGTVRRAALTAFGVGGRPVRMPEAEALLVEGGTAAVEDAAALVGTSLEALTDIHASAAYRRRVAAVLTRRALLQAIAEARR